MAWQDPSDASHVLIPAQVVVPKTMLVLKASVCNLDPGAAGFGFQLHRDQRAVAVFVLFPVIG